MHRARYDITTGKKISRTTLNSSNLSLNETITKKWSDFPIDTPPTSELPLPVKESLRSISGATLCWSDLLAAEDFLHYLTLDEFGYGERAILSKRNRAATC